MTGSERHPSLHDIESSPWATDQIPPATAPVVWDHLSSGDPDPVSGTPAATAADVSANHRRWQWPAVASGATLIAALALVSLSPDAATGEFATDVDDANPELGALPTLDGGVEASDGDQPAATSIGFSVDPVAEIGIDIVAVGQLGGMTHLDLDGAVATRWDAPDLPANQNPQLFADATRVFAVSGNGGTAFTSQFGRANELDIEAPLLPPFLPGPNDGTVWVRSPTAALDVDSMLIDLDGAPVDTYLRVAVDDAVLLGGGGSGSLLLATGGDIYTSAGGEPSGFTIGLNRLTTGEILAVGATHSVVRECNVVRQCTTSRLDRETRELTRITGFPFSGIDAVDDERDVSLIGSMSPDGDVVLVRLDSVISDDVAAAPMWTLFDIDSGAATRLGAPSQGQPLMWNDDSSYAVFASDDALFVYERSTATIIEVEGVGDVRGLTEVDESFSVAAVESDRG